MRPPRLIAWSLVAALGWSGAALAQQRRVTDPNPYLLQAMALYWQGDYEKCAARAEQARRRELTEGELLDLEIYSGLCAFRLGNEPKAAQLFDRALRMRVDIPLPDASIPRLQALWDSVRRHVLSGDPNPPPEALAPQPPPPVEPGALREKLLGIRLPGPRRNQLWAPVFLSGLALAAAGAGTYFGMHAKQLEREANAAPFESDAYALGDQARQSAHLANAGFGFCALGLTGAAVMVVFDLP